MPLSPWLSKLFKDLQPCFWNFHFTLTNHMAQILQLAPQWHLFGFAVNPACLNASNTAAICTKCSSQLALKIKISSMYTVEWSCWPSRTPYIALWKVAGAPISPKGILTNLYFAKWRTKCSLVSICFLQRNLIKPFWEIYFGKVCTLPHLLYEVFSYGHTVRVWLSHRINSPKIYTQSQRLCRHPSCLIILK